MRLDQLDYPLPKELIAQHPARQRDESKLMVLDPSTQRIYHEQFKAIEKYLQPGDALVLNDTRVLPARLLGTRVKTGGRWEGLFLGETTDGWEMLTKTRGRIEIGERVAIDGSNAELIYRGKQDDGRSVMEPSQKELTAFSLLESAGHMPLPPYIRGGRDEPSDFERYQTVFAQVAGSVAAPTAGLHFTPSLLDSLKAKGVSVEYVTLHVGIGTFLPIKTERLEDHVMHDEICTLTAESAKRLNQIRADGGRLVAVGTTSVRTIETAADSDGQLHAISEPTRLFIRPGYRFKAVDALLTNFHLPKSTLLALVAAFAGYEFVMTAYREAVQKKYRFFSYGDAMFITSRA